jgi:hypothetical protein
VRNNNITRDDYLIVDVNKFRIIRAADFALLGREVVTEPEEVG